MTGRSARVGRRWVVGGAVVTLTGCAGLFVATPPGKLYRLTAPRDFPPGVPHINAQILIDLPQAQAGIDTSRIALSKSPLTLDYFADSEWTDRVPELIQTLLLVGFENSGAIGVVDRNLGGLAADFVLQTEIRHFEAVYNGESAPRVWVEVIARLAAVRRRAIVAASAFEERAPARTNDIPAIVAAFDSAADAAVRDIVIWTLSNPALSPARRRLS